MGSKQSAPPPPDYSQIAQTQGVENRDTAQFNNAINRVDQLGPNGSSTWSVRPGADPNNPRPGDYIQTTSLSPEQQALQASQNRISTNLAGVAEGGLSRVGAGMATPFDSSHVNPLQTGLDLSKMRPLADGGSYGGQVKAVQDAMMSRMQPQLDHNRASAENRLLNSGIEKGTQAWDDAQRTIGQQENDASMQSILAGSQEQSRLAGLDLSANSQQFSQGLANQTFGNQASQQQLQQEAFLRQIPLNELNALRTGSQVSAPQFSGYYTGGGAAPADLAGAAQNQYTAAVGNVNAANAATAGTTTALTGLGSAAIMAF